MVQGVFLLYWAQKLYCLENIHPPGPPMAAMLRTAIKNALYMHTLICAFSSMFFDVETIIILGYDIDNDHKYSVLIYEGDMFSHNIKVFMSV
jgi:hypothetical protein